MKSSGYRPEVVRASPAGRFGAAVIGAGPAQQDGQAAPASYEFPVRVATWREAVQYSLPDAV